jgi:hypothetical protein
VKRRLVLLALVGLGAVLWKSGFGFLASERSVTWRFPVRYAEVRRLELQLWAQGELVKREERATPAGLAAEPVTRVPLERGPHLAVATLWLAGGGEPRIFRDDFDPGMAGDIVLSFAGR